MRPPSSCPAKNEFFLPTAIGLIDRPHVLLSSIEMPVVEITARFRDMAQGVADRLGQLGFTGDFAQLRLQLKL